MLPVSHYLSFSLFLSPTTFPLISVYLTLSSPPLALPPLPPWLGRGGELHPCDCSRQQLIGNRPKNCLNALQMMGQLRETKWLNGIPDIWSILCAAEHIDCFSFAFSELRHQWEKFHYGIFLWIQLALHFEMWLTAHDVHTAFHFSLRPNPAQNHAVCGPLLDIKNSYLQRFSFSLNIAIFFAIPIHSHSQRVFCNFLIFSFFPFSFCCT